MGTHYRSAEESAAVEIENSNKNVLSNGYILTNPETGTRYRIMDTLNRGGFGIIYEAQVLDTGLQVAIKELFPREFVSRGADGTVKCPGNTDQFQSMQTSFLKEARVLKQLSHIKSVVHIYDFFCKNQTAYYVMEFVSGTNLKDYIQKHGPLSFQAYQPQFQRLMQDIEELHSHGVIHRDITPDNIMLTKKAQFKLVDFGSARKQDCQKLTVHIKQNFAPIEQYYVEGKQSAYTDVYSLAATIYYCCTGRVVADALSRLNGRNLIPAKSYGADLTSEQEKALEKALEIRPENRFQTMQEFEQHLFTTSSFSPEISESRDLYDKSKVSYSSSPGVLQRIKMSWIYLKQEPLLPVLGGILFLGGLVFQLIL